MSEKDSHSRDDDWDFEGEWEQARAASEREKDASQDDETFPASGHPGDASETFLAEISPYSLLYTGFLLGPGATFLAMLILMGRRFNPRAAIFTLGVCGAAWTIIQAATLGLHQQWAPMALQAMRTLVNFFSGVLLFWFATRKSEIHFRHNRQTLFNTAVFVMLLVVVFSVTPTEILLWLGR